MHPVWEKLARSVEFDEKKARRNAHTFRVPIIIGILILTTAGFVISYLLANACSNPVSGPLMGDDQSAAAHGHV